MEEQLHEFIVLLTFSWADYGIKSQKLKKVVSVGQSNAPARSHMEVTLTNGLCAWKSYNVYPLLSSADIRHQREKAFAVQARVYYLNNILNFEHL
jgi:hypothetical protein